MAVLISGGAGFIGAHAVRTCVDRGLAVVVLDDGSRGGAFRPPRGVETVTGDIGDARLVRAVLDSRSVHTVLHFAALTDVAQSSALPARYYAVNTAATATLAQVCVEAKVRRFVLSSTAAVYGDRDGPAAETSPLTPASPYAASKAMAERMLYDIAGDRMACAMLRYFNVAGPQAEGRTAPFDASGPHLIRRACQVALGRAAALEVFGDDWPTLDGAGVRDFVHVHDIADAHIAVLGKMAAGQPLLLNLGCGLGYSVFEVVRAVEQAASVRLPLHIRPRRPGDVAVSVASVERARNTIGWRPRFGLAEMVAHTLADEAATNDARGRLRVG